jgi:hypothetical protein
VIKDLLRSVPKAQMLPDPEKLRKVARISHYKGA